MGVNMIAKHSAHVWHRRTVKKRNIQDNRTANPKFYILSKKKGKKERKEKKKRSCRSEGKYRLLGVSRRTFTTPRRMAVLKDSWGTFFTKGRCADRTEAGVKGEHRNGEATSLLSWLYSLCNGWQQTLHVFVFSLCNHSAWDSDRKCHGEGAGEMSKCLCSSKWLQIYSKESMESVSLGIPRDPPHNTILWDGGVPKWVPIVWSGSRVKGQWTTKYKNRILTPTCLLHHSPSLRKWACSSLDSRQLPLPFPWTGNQDYRVDICIFWFLRVAKAPHEGTLKKTNDKLIVAMFEWCPEH